MAPAIDLRILSPVFCDGSAISGCVSMLSEHVQSQRLRVECWIPGAYLGERRDFMRTPLPHLVTRGVYKIGLEAWLKRRLERAYRNSFGDQDVAWVWPGTSLSDANQTTESINFVRFEAVAGVPTVCIFATAIHGYMVDEPVVVVVGWPEEGVAMVLASIVVFLAPAEVSRMWTPARMVAVD